MTESAARSRLIHAVTMYSKNERVELEMRILKYRNLLPRITDDQFQMRAKEMIAELEQKLRQSTSNAAPVHSFFQAERASRE